MSSIGVEKVKRVLIDTLLTGFYWRGKQQIHHHEWNNNGSATGRVSKDASRFSQVNPGPACGGEAEFWSRLPRFYFLCLSYDWCSSLINYQPWTYWASSPEWDYCCNEWAYWSLPSLLVMSQLLGFRVESRQARLVRYNFPLDFSLRKTYGGFCISLQNKDDIWSFRHLNGSEWEHHMVQIQEVWINRGKGSWSASAWVDDYPVTQALRCCFILLPSLYRNRKKSMRAECPFGSIIVNHARKQCYYHRLRKDITYSIHVAEMALLLRNGFGICRNFGVFGWLHEHCHGADRGVCEWAAEEQVWWCFHSGQQWWALFLLWTIIWTHALSSLLAVLLDCTPN